MTQEANKSWQYRMRETVQEQATHIRELIKDNERLTKEVAFLRSLVGGQPTLLTACEKIVDAAAHMTVEANGLVRLAQQTRREK